MRNQCPRWFGCGLLCVASSTGAQTLSLDPVVLLEDAHADSPSPSDSYGVTSSWFGARDNLAKDHIIVGGSVLFDTSKVLRGGLRTRAWPMSYLLDIHALADMQAIAGWTGGTAFVDFQSHDQSGNGDNAVGDIQNYDTQTAPRYTQIAQVWYKQAIGDVVRLKVGKIDANADAANPGDDAQDAFSLIEHSLDSIHAAPTYPPTIFALPTYPEAAPGLEAFFGNDVYLGLGAFYSNRHQTFLNISGHPEKVYAAAGGMFFIAEAGARWKWGDSPGHAGVGAWMHTGEFPRVDGNGTSQNSGGGYVFGDQSLIHEEGDKPHDVGIFFNAGIADKVTDPMDQSASAGITATGFVPGRPDDSIGLMASWAHLPTQPGLVHSFELANELYYKLQITKWVSVKPAFQYINHPSGMHPDAAVVTVRVEVDF